MLKKLIIIIVLILLIGGVFYFWLILNSAVSQVDQEKLFVIRQGDGSWQVSKNLKAQGLVRSAAVLEIYWWLSGQDTKVQAGEIKLNTALTIKRIAQLLTGEGTFSNEITIQIIEGWTQRQINNYLTTKTSAAKDFADLVSHPKPELGQKYLFLADKPPSAGLEGYLFPDTYRVYTKTSAQVILEKILDNFDKKLTVDLRQEIAKQKKSILEIITLASIVEKEVATDPDRALVADIFWRRLKIGMALQADSTVNYVTGKNTPRASAADLAVDSRYNTYKYRGLPPGPIANPGLAAIKAAVYPQKNDYLYFLTTPEGRVIYSKTFPEHQANIAKYLK